MIYINDLPDTIQNILKLFGDDTKLFGKVNTVGKANIIQDDVGRAADWSEDWQISSNNKKGKHMHLGSENDFSKYYMTHDKSGEPIDTVQEEKDLVVTRATEILKSKSVRSTDDIIKVIRTCIRQSQIVTKTNDSSFSSKSVSEIDF